MKKYIIFPLICVLFSFVSCNDEWDDHYDSNKEVNGSDLLTTMKSNPQLSKFVQMIEISGFSGKVAGSGSFTIWAPDNDALVGISLTDLTSEDSLAIKKIVTNHMAWSYYSTSSIFAGEKRIFMVNEKFIKFGKDGNNYTFGEIPVVPESLNKICSNGVLYILNGQVPYLNNIWESIQADADLSKLYEYINRFDSTYMDKDRSTLLYINDDGEKVYDTVFVIRNTLLEKIGELYLEDSVYTCVAPLNTAYQTQFDKFVPYYKSNGGPNAALNSDSVTSARVNRTIVNGLIFRDEYENLIVKDSILSSGGMVSYRPAEILNGQPVTTSNGTILMTSELNLDIKELMYKKLFYEVEELSVSNEELSIELANYSYVYPQLLPWTDLISKGYIRLVQITTSTYPRIDIYFGDKILSAKYDIYCTIVPTVAEDATKTDDKAILDFTLVYREGRSNRTKTLLTGYETSPTELEEVLVAEGVEIPYVDSKVGLRVALNRNSKAPNYSGTFRIDNIRLVPSQD